MLVLIGGLAYRGASEMPCFHPIEVKIKRKSLYSARGVDDWVVVPCGNCTGCRAEQGRQWAVRMMHESRMHEKNIFVTLTLDDRHLNENRDLCAKDLSRFFKSLRKTQKRRVSFFGCGEYGEKTGRPHYHALCFGVDFLDRDVGFDLGRPNVWRSKTLADLWGRGLVEGGSVTMASASYVAGYIRKKVRNKDFVRANPITGELMTPEFSRMSLRPAIGKRWIERWWRDVYPRDFVVIDGVEAKPPRYYDKWMDANHPTLMEEVRKTRYDEAEDLTRYQLDSKEAILKSRINLFARRDAL